MFEGLRLFIQWLAFERLLFPCSSAYTGGWAINQYPGIRGQFLMPGYFGIINGKVKEQQWSIMISYLWNQGVKAASIPEASCPCMRGCVTLDMGKSLLALRSCSGDFVSVGSVPFDMRPLHHYSSFIPDQSTAIPVMLVDSVIFPRLMRTRLPSFCTWKALKVAVPGSRT